MNMYAAGGEDMKIYLGGGRVEGGVTISCHCSMPSYIEHAVLGNIGISTGFLYDVQ